MGLEGCAAGAPTRVTLRSSTEPPVKPIVAVMGGLGAWPWKIARMNSRRLSAAPWVSSLIGSSRVIVRLRRLVRISVIESDRLLQLGGDVFVNRSDSDAPEGKSRDGAGEGQSDGDLPAVSKCGQDLCSSRRAQQRDENRDSKGEPELPRHAVDGAAGRKARWGQRSRRCAGQRWDHESDPSTPDEPAGQKLRCVVRLQPNCPQPPQARDRKEDRAYRGDVALTESP